MKAKSYSWLLVFCGMLLGGIVQAQYSMDLKVDYDTAADAAILELFPTAAHISSFKVECYDAGETLLSTFVYPSNDTVILLTGITANGIEKVRVIAQDSAAVELEQTPLETVIKPQATPLACQSASAAPAASTGCGFNLILKDTETSTFPWIYTTLRAEDDAGNAISGLTVNDFFVTEDGRPQNIQLTAQYGVDVVFCIDYSGSMGNKIAQVIANARAFADQLVANGVDYRLGLVSFGQSSGSGQPFTVFDSSNPADAALPGLTDDVEVFKRRVNRPASGGWEPGVCAVYHALTDPSLLWRPGVLKVVVVITDEPDNNGSCGDFAMVCQKIQDEQAQVYAATATTYDYVPLVECSEPDGKRDNVTANINFLLNDIWPMIVSDYIVFYETDNPAEDCTQRLVETTAPDDPNCTDTVSFSYTPNSSPKIVRTQATIDLHLNPLVDSTPVTLCAEVTDCAPPFVNAVSLYVRTTGTSTYTELPMVGGLNGIWCADVPAGMVQTPGIDYYILATDGDKTSTHPTTEPSLNPYQLAVLPNVAPVITHVPPASANPNVDCDLTIGVEDQTIGVAKLTLYHRITGQLLYNKVEIVYGQDPNHPMMSQISEVLTIPHAKIAEPSIEYYIKAVDNYGLSSYWGTATADDPYVLPVHAKITCDLDIKPTSCPNPFNVTAKGVLPVAILGSESLDVTQIDVASLRLASVAPIRSSIEDVASPVAESNGCDCTTAGPDGFMDLKLKFDRQELVEVIGDVEHDDVLTLAIEGATVDGTPIEGQDCIVIRGRHLGLGKADTNDDGVVNFLDLINVSEKWLQKEVLKKR